MLLNWLGLLALGPAHAAVTIQWTDPMLTPSVTTIRKVHVDELRAQINTLRDGVSMPRVNWSSDNSPAIPGRAVLRAVHLQEMRVALEQIYAVKIMTAPVWTDALTANVTRIRAVHIAELRAAIEAVPRCEQRSYTFTNGQDTWVNIPNGVTEVTFSARGGRGGDGRVGAMSHPVNAYRLGGGGGGGGAAGAWSGTGYMPRAGWVVLVGGGGGGGGGGIAGFGGMGGSTVDRSSGKGGQGSSGTGGGYGTAGADGITNGAGGGGGSFCVPGYTCWGGGGGGAPGTNGGFAPGSPPSGGWGGGGGGYYFSLSGQGGRVGGGGGNGWGGGGGGYSGWDGAGGGGGSSYFHPSLRIEGEKVSIPVSVIGRSLRVFGGAGGSGGGSGSSVGLPGGAGTITVSWDSCGSP